MEEPLSAPQLNQASPEPPTPVVDLPLPPNEKGHIWRLVGLSLVVIIPLLVIVLGGGWLVASSALKRQTSNPNESASYDQIPLPRALSSYDQLTLGSKLHFNLDSTVTINGPFIIAPSTQPATATAGQTYYDQTTNELRYYNGTNFVSVASSDNTVSSFAGVTGRITLGSGLFMTGGQLGVNLPSVQSQGVTSLQGRTGAVNLVPGAGIGISGTTISNSGVTSFNGATGAATGVGTLVSNSGNLIVASDGNGNYSLTDNTVGGAGLVQLGPVSAQNDNTNNPSIFVDKTGTNGFLRLQTSGVDRFVVDNTGAITTGQISWSQVTAKPNFVNSVTGTTNQINTSAASGNIILSLPQDINVTSTPTFAGLTLTAPLGVASGGTGLSTTPTNGKLLIGNGTGYSLANLTSGDSTVVITNGAGTINLSAPGAGTCATCVSLQGATPGTPQTGNINISGTVIAGTFSGGNFSGNGSALTNLNGANITAGTVANAALANNSLTVTAGTGLSGGGSVALGASTTLNLANTTVTPGTYGSATEVGQFTVDGQGRLTSAINVPLSGLGTCATCVALQATTPGTPQTGHINVSGTIIAGTFSGNGAALTSLNATNISSGTLNDLRLSANVTLLGQTIGLSELEADSVNSSKIVDGSVANSDLANNSLTVTAGGGLVNGGSVALGASTTLNIGAGDGITVNADDVAVDSTVCRTSGNCLGGGAGGANTALSNLSSVAINTSLLTGAATIDLGSAAAPFRDLYLGGTPTNNIRITGTSAAARVYTVPDVGANASFCLSTGNCGGGGGVTGSGTPGTLSKFTGASTIGDSLLSESGSAVTVAGSLSATSFSGNGASLTSLNASNLSSGTVADARLTSNVTLQGNTFNGTNQLVQLNGSTQLPAVSGALLTNLNASNVASGTLSDARLSSNVSLLGQSIGLSELEADSVNSGKIVDGSVAAADLANTTVAAGTYGSASEVGQFTVDAQGRLTSAGNVAISGLGTCATCVSLQASTPGTAQTGNINVSGTIIAGTFSGNGAALTSLNASNLSSGTVAVARGGTGQSSYTDGQLLIGNTSTGGLNAATLTAGAGITITNGNGTITIASPNAGSCATCVSLQGTTPGTAQTGNINISGTIIASVFSGDGSALTNLNATNLSSGTVADARLTSNVTLQGNTFNGASQLVQLNGSTQLPAISGALLTNLNASNIASGTLVVARGGTGAGTFTTNGVLYGNGTGALQVTAAGTTNQCFLGNTGAAPSFGACPSGPVTTLQQAYDASTGGATPEIKLDSTRTGLDIQDADTTTGTSLFNIRASNGAGLGASLLSVGNTGATTFQNSVNSTTAFQVQNAASTDVLTVDTTNSATILRGINPDATIGSEGITSQAFNNATYWTNCNGGAGGWTGTATTAAHNTGNTTACIATATNITVTAGTTYQIQFQLAGNGTETNTVTASIGGASAPAIGTTGTNTHTYVITASNTGALTFTPTLNFNGTISAISVKVITTTKAVLQVKNVSNTVALEVRASGSTSNTFIGLNAGLSNTTSGTNNTAIGSGALQSNTTGTQNTAIGTSALQVNTTGIQNTAIGTSALQANTSGTQNTALGYQALLSNTTGTFNVVVGGQALLSNTIGSSNTAIGTAALSGNTTGSSNIALGTGALSGNTTGSNNIAIGNSTFQSNNTGSNNIALGNSSFQANTSGNQNIAIGTSALRVNSTGNYNTGIGYQTLYSNTFGNYNVTLGNQSLYSNNIGTQNTALGYQGLFNNLTGSNNTSLGYQALYSNSTSSQNTAIGTGALYNTSGSSNTALGFSAFYNNTTGSNNTALGYNAGYADSGTIFTLNNLSNSTALGYASQVQQNNALILGGQDSNAVNVGIGTTMPTNLLSVSPVSYSTGTAGTGGVSSTTVTGSGTTWDATMIGSEIIFANLTASTTPQKATITAVASSTSMTVTPAVTVANGTTYRIHRPVLQVTTAGNVGIGTATPTARLQVAGANTTTAFQVQNAAGTSIFNVDTTNAKIGTANTTAVSTNSQVLTIKSGDASGTTSNSGNVVIDSGTATGTAGNISIGAGAYAHNTTIGNTTGSSGLVLNSGTGNVQIGAGNLIANGAATGTTGTTSGAGGSNVTSITLSAAGSFANNDVILVDNTGGSGQDYYTRIVSGGGTTTLTVSPAVSYGTAAGYTGNATITKYTVQNIGATTTDYTTLNNRFFQGYFLGGVVTGAGSTTLSDGNLTSTGALNFSATEYNFKRTADSATAFQVQNAAGVSLLTADTTNSRVYVGSPTADAVGAILVLDTKNTAGDPTGVNGATYYNSSTNKFRCYENGAWADCLSGGGVAFLQGGNSFSGTTAGDIGTNNNGNLNFRTNGTTKLTLNTSGFLSFAQGSDRMLNIAQATSGAGNNLYIAAGNAQASGNVNGGNLIFQGGTGNGTGSTGSVIVRSSADSTNAFQIQNSSSNSLLTANTTAMNLTVAGDVYSNTPSLGTPDVYSLKMDAVSAGDSTAVAVASDGLPIVIYTNSTALGGGTDAAKCTTSSCSSSTKRKTYGAAGKYASMAIGANGLPTISSYIESGSNDLYVLTCADSRCTTYATAVAPDSTGDVGQYTSTLIGSDGFPVVSYYDVTNANLKILKCGNASCSSGNTITAVDSTGDVGKYTSIKLGTDNLPVVSYYDVTNANLKILKCGNASCSSGNTITAVDSTGDVGQYTSIAIPSTNLPVVSYYDTTNISLKILKCGNASCSSGNTVTVADAGYTGFNGTEYMVVNIGRHSSIAIGSDGFPIVSYNYSDSTNDNTYNYGSNSEFLRVLDCSNATCASGNTITGIDSAYSNYCDGCQDEPDANSVGSYTSISVPADGKPVISYYYDAEKSVGVPGRYVKVIKCTNTTCSAPTTASLGGGVSLGSETANFNSAYINSIYTPDANTPLSVVTNGIERLSISGTGQALFKSDNSTTAFQVQNAGGTTVFNVDTTNSRVGIGTNAPGNLLSVGALTTADSTGRLAIGTGAAGNKGLIIQGVVSQTGDLLQAQDSTGAVLAKIDASGNLTVKNAVINGTLTVNGHIVTANASGSTTVAIGAGATCTSGSSATVSGNDTSGTITFTAGSGAGCASGVMATITFANAFAAAPKVVFSAANAGATALQYYNNGTTTTTFTIDSNNAPIAGTQYKFNYWATQ